ncbi:MAG: hypothetical protein JWQ38_2241 [Flavipsychrobacter sp.]|nr:hypothetical protein [Flavipsychrobacter sp.]
MVILKKVLLLLCCIPFIAALVFAVCYLASDYETLKHWYLSLNGCFYERETWAINFFTPASKLKGNIWSLMGVAISVSGVLYLYCNRQRYTTFKRNKQEPVYYTDWIWYTLIITFSIITCTWSVRLISPSYDEVFSAVNCAEMPAFQIMSYYMLPNNHILFNLINHFAGWNNDKIASGRILSCIAYAATMLCIFYWLRKLINNRLFAFLILLPVALQFTTLGFAGLARGYSLLLFCGWIALMSYAQFINTTENSALRTNTVFNILGFLLIPSYLYFYFAQILFYLVLSLYTRNIRLKYWKHQLMLACIVFLFYMPAFCFSGADSFTRNKNFKPIAPDVFSFIPNLLRASRAFTSYCFSYIGGENNIISCIFFCVPLLLFFSKDKQKKAIALFYFVLWAACILWTCKVRYLPYQRTVAIQFSITMVIVTYTFYWLTEIVASWFKKIRCALILVIFVFPLLIYCQYLSHFDEGNFFYLLYGYNITDRYTTQKGLLRVIPAGSSIACSDESFYLHYLFQENGNNVSHCANGNEDYYIISLDDHRPLPIESNNNYVLFSDKITEYLVYKRKEIK